jgi:glycosyltransferase involved in cell wall biosynthesis
MRPEDPRPKVSVVTITYNHAAYIAQALESILTQETDFPFEVIVADDCSTDSTPSIIREFAERHPDVVVPVLRPENIGIHANFVSAAALARGDYVALCEGDDYWTDVHKLQRQSDVLDSRPDVYLCAHPVMQVWEGGEKPDSVWPDEDERADTSFRALLRSNFVPTNSTLSRRLPDYTTLPDIMPLDWYLHMRHARGHDVVVLDDVMGVYRRHPGGVWYGSHSDPDAFWVDQAPAMAAFTDAVLELVADDPDDLAATEEWSLWVARLFSIRSREGDDAEVGKVLGANPRFAGLLARAYAQRVDDLEWQRGQLDQQAEKLRRVSRRLRRTRRQLRLRIDEAAAAPPRRRRRWPF